MYIMSLLFSKYLDQHGYHVRVFTRDPQSEHSQRLRGIAPNVQYVTGTSTDEDALRSAFAGVDYAFVNLNSFALGIKNEIYWGIRTFEIAVQSGVEYYTKYDDDLRCGHYYGKGHVKQWMSALPQSPMKWSVVCTGPCIEQLWYFPHPKKSDSRQFAGLNLDIGVEDVSLEQIAKAFTDTTGKPGKATNLTIEQWTQETWLLEEDMEHKIGTSTAPGDPSLLTFRQNFSAWWRIYQDCGGNTELELCNRGYSLLDESYPGRMRSLKRWMEKVGYDGDTTRTFEAGIPWGM
ncbi:hypothetical protein V8C34DRAFT_314874 [Trichoderma compactum]